MKGEGSSAAPVRARHATVGVAAVRSRSAALATDIAALPSARAKSAAKGRLLADAEA